MTERALGAMCLYTTDVRQISLKMRTLLMSE